MITPPPTGWFDRFRVLQDDEFEYEEWTGPGIVVHADYHQFYFETHPDAFWLHQEWIFTYGPEVAEIDRFGRGVIQTIAKSGPMVVTGELLDAPPAPAGSTWDEVAEVTLPIFNELLVRSFLDGPDGCPADVPPGNYRLRVHRHCEGAEWDWHTGEIHELYHLVLWPASPDDERCAEIRREVADAEERLHAEQSPEFWAEPQFESWDETDTWGEDENHEFEPEHAPALLTVDAPDLAEALARLSPQSQREVARWTARRIISGQPGGTHWLTLLEQSEAGGAVGAHNLLAPHGELHVQEIDEIPSLNAATTFIRATLPDPHVAAASILVLAIEVMTSDPLILHDAEAFISTLR